MKPARVCVYRLVMSDITERKRAEAEKAKLEAQFQQAQKMESVGRSAGGVAHDFSNMLQAILGNVDLAFEKVPPRGPLRESLEEIQKAALRSADLTRQLLAFARQQTITPKVLDLNDALEGLLKMLRRLIGEDIHLFWLPGGGRWGWSKWIRPKSIRYWPISVSTLATPSAGVASSPSKRGMRFSTRPTAPITWGLCLASMCGWR